VSLANRSASKSHRTSHAGSPLFPSELIISVKEARKILGKWSKDLPDDEIERIITLLHVISEGIVNAGSDFPT